MWILCPLSLCVVGPGTIREERGETMACRRRRSALCLWAVPWALLEHALLAAGFWAIPTQEERQGVMLDGATWIIEGRRRDVYRVLRRDSPRGPIFELGRAFLDIAGPPVAEIQLY
jgi:hypothetical protein